jgi:hypothetical protein
MHIYTHTLTHTFVSEKQIGYLLGPAPIVSLNVNKSSSSSCTYSIIECELILLLLLLFY